MKQLTPFNFIGLEGIQPRNDDGGEMKSHRIQKAPKGISFILHGARNAKQALCAQGHHNGSKIFFGIAFQCNLNINQHKFNYSSISTSFTCNYNSLDIDVFVVILNTIS